MAIMIESDKGISKLKAGRIWRKLKKEIAYFPLQWDKLSHVEIRGDLEESLDVYMHFSQENETLPVVITAIHVGYDFEILQYGTNYGSLTY